MTRAVLGFPKVATKKKANHLRRNRTREHRRIIKELDALARHDVVIVRDENICQRCKAREGEVKNGRVVQIQWSHIHSRRHHCLRWSDENSQALCKDCHCWWTNNPGLAYDWFAKTWPLRWERITRVLQSNPKVNVKELLAEFKKHGTN